MKLLLTLLLVVDYFWPLWDRENRALHDFVMGSRVIAPAGEAAVSFTGDSPERAGRYSPEPPAPGEQVWRHQPGLVVASAVFAAQGSAKIEWSPIRRQITCG